MKKEKVFFDKSEFHARQRIYQKALKHLQELAELYNSLGIGYLTKKRLDEMFAGNFAAIEKDVWTAAKEDLNIKSQFLHDALSETVNAKLVEFKQQVKELTSAFKDAQHTTNRVVHIDTDVYSINNGKILFGEKDIQKLKDQCSLFIETEKQREFYELLKTAEKANKACKKFLNDNEIRTPLFFVSGISEGFVAEYFDEVSIHPELMFDVLKSFK